MLTKKYEWGSMGKKKLTSKICSQSRLEAGDDGDVLEP
jgi:hypothetical protein